MSDDWEHGVVGTYTNRRCRCDACRGANSEYQAHRKAQRREQLAENPGLAPHGIATTYSNWGCRCPKCTEAWRTACAGRAERRKA